MPRLGRRSVDDAGSARPDDLPVVAKLLNSEEFLSATEVLAQQLGRDVAASSKHTQALAISSNYAGNSFINSTACRSRLMPLPRWARHGFPRYWVDRTTESPSRSAQAIAWARLTAPYFRRMCFTCDLTVPSVITNLSAIA